MNGGSLVHPTPEGGRRAGTRMLCQFPEHERVYRSQSWKVRLLHLVASAAGVLIHIDGLPYGSTRNYPRAAGRSGETGSTCSSC